MKSNFLSAFKAFLHPETTASKSRRRYMGDFIVVMLGVIGLLGVHMAQAVPGTTVTLALSSSSVTSGTAVTMTASVLHIVTPVTVGTVTFCDATAAYCENSAIIGTAQLTSAGTAVIRVTPSIGTHSYSAIFTATTSIIQGGTSAPQSLTVTGMMSPTTTAISSTGSAGNYTLVGTVVGTGSTSLAPTGAISFADTSNANFILGSTLLGPATLKSNLVLKGTPFNVPSTYAVYVVAGDFNNDGIADLAIAGGSGSTSFYVCLGNGDGTFQSPVSYTVGNQPFAIATGDFNGDGNLDLAVVNGTSGSVSILLGKGDGTFPTINTYPTGVQPYSVAVGDFNDDGRLDLAVTNSGSTNVGVLLGNGDGTFQTMVPYPVGNTPQAIVAADFNGDGKIDLAVANSGDGTIGILIGMGDGTFNLQVTYPSGIATPQQLVAGDFNGDGSPDLAIAGVTTVNIFLNNGDGTFQVTPTHSYPVTGTAYSLAVSDLNADGKADLLEASYSATDTRLLAFIGKGDGSFQIMPAYTTGLGPRSIAVGDFNRDGFPDVAVANRIDHTVSVFLNNITQTGTASISSVSIPGNGTHKVAASYPGDSNFTGSISSTISLTASPVTTALTLTANPTSSTVGQSVLLTATLNPSSLGGLTTTGETVTFYNGSTNIGTGTLSSLGVATLSTSTLPLGTDNLTVFYFGDTNFLGSNSAVVREVVNPVSTGVLNMQGRWEFAVTSGDTPAQISQMGQSTISSYLLQTGTALTIIPAYNSDTIACDIDVNGNASVSNSSIDSNGNVIIDFTFAQNGSPNFDFVFTGALSTGSPTVIVGTYQRTVGGCTQGSLGTGTPDGAFVATYFPDISGTWNGAFDPDTGTGPASPATFNLSTNSSDKSLSGTVSAATLLSSDGITPCFASVVTLQPGMSEGISQAAGIGMELFGSDTNGTTLWVNAYVTNPDGSVAAVGEDNPIDGGPGTINDGTNNAYTAFYGITGGPCDGYGGGDAPFKIANKSVKPPHRHKMPPPKHHAKPNHRFHAHHSRTVQGIHPRHTQEATEPKLF